MDNIQQEKFHSILPSINKKHILLAKRVSSKGVQNKVERQFIQQDDQQFQDQSLQYQNEEQQFLQEKQIQKQIQNDSYLETELSQLKTTAREVTQMNSLRETRQNESLKEVDTNQENFFDKVMQGHQTNNPGPEFDEQGNIKATTIAGYVEWFQREEQRRQGNLTEEINHTQEISLTQRNRAISTKLKQNLKSGVYRSGRINSTQKQKKELDQSVNTELEFIEEDFTKDDVCQQIEEVIQRVQKNRQEEWLSITEKDISNQLDQENKIMLKFNIQQDQWVQQIKKTTQSAKRQIDESIYMVSQNFRAKMEAQRALDLIEPDIKRYGDRYWIMTLRQEQNQKISKNVSRKVIDDVPRCFGTYKPVQQQSQLEIIRKPISSKLYSKVQNQIPFNTFNSGVYLQERLGEQNDKADKIQIMKEQDQFEYLYVDGQNVLEKEVKNLLVPLSNNQTNNNKLPQFKRKMLKQDLSSSKLNEPEIIEQNYDKSVIQRLPQINRNQILIKN